MKDSSSSQLFWHKVIIEESKGLGTWIIYVYVPLEFCPPKTSCMVHIRWQTISSLSKRRAYKTLIYLSQYTLYYAAILAYLLLSTYYGTSFHSSNSFSGAYLCGRHSSFIRTPGTQKGFDKNCLSHKATRPQSPTIGSPSHHLRFFRCSSWVLRLLLFS